MDHEADKDATPSRNRAAIANGRNYAPKLDPSWPGNLLSWEMSDPQTLKSRVDWLRPHRSRSTKGLNLWSYRRIVTKSKFNDDAKISDVTIVNWPQNDYFLGNLYDNEIEVKPRGTTSPPTN